MRRNWGFLVGKFPPSPVKMRGLRMSKKPNGEGIRMKVPKNNLKIKDVRTGV
jgi:hypothetical protein